MIFNSFEENVVPASLLDKTLCKFRHDVTHLEPTHNDYTDFHALQAEIFNSFDHEIDRQTALNNVLARILPERPDSNTKGNLSVIVGDKKFFYYVQDLRNNLPGLNIIPNIKLMNSYVENCRHHLEEKEFSWCNLPAILLCQIGPLLDIAVAVFTERPVVEHITSILLNIHSTNLKQMKAGARSIAALRAATLELKSIYPDLITNRQRQAEYPFPRSFTYANKSFTFTYTDPLHDKLVFRARVNQTNSPIFVKFSLQYSKDAHALAHDRGFAPKLLAVERIEKWYMIIMEGHSDDFIPLLEAKTDWLDFTSVQKEVKRQVKNLQDAGYLQGDIRDVNMLITKQYDHHLGGPGEWFLVDWN
ncbi:hypothetical protein DL96DRAFT_1529909 [Flagelloscypha sp. PMI_526]|nr:hypothetical protein DL96DRAFT_1529909 [Flagelloscypha sp. PMI_526]